MPIVTYVQFDGIRHELDLPEGQSVMQGAVSNMLDGIVGECCGSMACGTCHCYVDEAWLDKVGPASVMEQEVLRCSPVAFKPTSRLACQIESGAALDGLVVYLPESQF